MLDVAAPARAAWQAVDAIGHLALNVLKIGWWQGGKKLTVYVGDGNAEYVQVWGIDADREMAEGNADGRDARRRLWRWLGGV